MAFLDSMNFDDVVEPKAVVAGEYELQISEIAEGVDKNGFNYILPKFQIVDEVGAKVVTRYMALPSSQMDPDKLNRSKLALKRFFDAMGIDASQGVDLDSLTGERVWALLGVEEDKEYGEGNFIKRFISKG